MVVMVIIGIFISIAVLSVGVVRDDRAIRQQALRLSTLIEMASDEAQMQGREYGVELMRTGYRFVEFDPILLQWAEIIGDDLLRPRSLGDDMEFELALEDRNVLLAEAPADMTVPEDPTERDYSDDYQPHLMIMSSGEITPFDIRIIRDTDQRSVLVSLSPAGEMEMQSSDDETF
ncbi:MAG: type II secretion system minor pseudopilin GspH [Gammaproteobacteria bacterium]|nr:type II secretion system minor pseudopilin GspH [Gammaproteobacteria bacterium]